MDEEKKKPMDAKKAPPSEHKRKKIDEDEKEKITEAEGGTEEKDERVFTWVLRYDESHFGEGVFFEHTVEAKDKIEAVNSWLTHLFRTGLLTVVKQEKASGVNPYI